MFLSPLTSRLKTNYVPTDDELFELRGWYAAPKAKIGKLDAEIERAQTELNALITQRDELQQMVLDYRALESPLRRFPVDLLREIFFHCLPKSNNAIMIAQEAPLVLTHICSSWRSVALSTPTLWASFHLPVPPHNVATTSNFFFRTNSELDSFQAAATESMQKRRRGVEVFLSRSAKCSLDISLHDMEQSPVVPNKYCDIFLDMIIPLSHRWRSMSFTTSEHHLERIAALTNNDVPELEKLVINQTSHQPELNEGDPVTSWFGSTFFNASRLRDVSLTNIDHVDMLPFRWPDLTHISMTRLPRGFGTVSNICTLLRKCRRLVSARLMISADELPWALNVIPGAGPGTGLPLSKSVLSNTPIVLPDLVNLSLISNGKNLSDFFSNA